MLQSAIKAKTFPVVFFASFFIAVSLTIACWNINFWPSDAEVYYMPAAKELPSLKYLSQIHDSLDEERIKWLHGKEYHVLAISIFQRMLNDTESLRPLLLLGVVCIFLSALLIFSIARRLIGERPAFWVWLLFTTSFWPYLYILFTKHQTQGLLFFLLSVWFLISGKGWWRLAAAGAALSVSIFSSTVSMLYVPFVAAAFFDQRKHWIKDLGICAAGFAAMVVLANAPDVVGNLKEYWEYISISGNYNHFFYNQRALVQWLPEFNLKDTKGGWEWIFKYFLLVMPVIFPLYIASAIYLLLNKRFPIVILSALPVLLAYAKGVAQYGANFFPALPGMLLLIGFTILQMHKQKQWDRFKHPAIALIVIQVAVNFYVFASEIYPARMVTTLISKTLEDRGIKELHTFRTHPLRPNILDHLNKDTLKQLRLMPIDSVVQAGGGYILLPPVSTDSIYRASNGDYNNFDEDLILNQIVRQNKLDEYAIAKFKTLSSSLIWSQEEEILAYRYLVLNQFKGGPLSFAYLLDGAKIQKDRSLFEPSQEDLVMYRNNIRNIGTETKLLMYTPYQGGVGRATTLKGLAARMFKVGNPTDQVRAFVFKVDPKQPMWIPYAPQFMSQPVDASAINNFPGSEVVFPFNPPLQLETGAFSVVIYRTGKDSDQNHYRIFANALGRLEE